MSKSFMPPAQQKLKITNMGREDQAQVSSSTGQVAKISRKGTYLLMRRFKRYTNIEQI